MVYHILKDGTQTTDITGHIVKKDDAITLYELLSLINKRASTK